MRTIEEAKRRLGSITDADQRKIKGGNGVPLTQAQLNKLFDYTNISAADATEFNTEIGRLAQTNLGSAILYELLAKVSQTGVKIKLDDKITDLPSNALGQYINGTLKFGGVAGYSTTYIKSLFTRKGQAQTDRFDMPQKSVF